MTLERDHQSGPVPEADLLEQQTPLVPAATDEEEPEDIPDAPTEPVDEADWSEQRIAVPTPDDSYPHALYQAWEV